MDMNSMNGGLEFEYFSFPRYSLGPILYISITGRFGCDCVLDLNVIKDYLNSMSCD